MPPPPPPPPGPGPPGPPPPPTGAPAPKMSAMPDRKGLLGDIAKGRQLKKAVTNDRSAPTVGGGIVAPASSASSSLGRPPTIPGSVTPAQNVQNVQKDIPKAPQLAGIFAGGMPTLKKTSNGTHHGGSSIMSERDNRSVSSPIPRPPPTIVEPRNLNINSGQQRQTNSLASMPSNAPPPLPSSPVPPIPHSAKTSTSNASSSKPGLPPPPPAIRKPPGAAPPSATHSRDSSSGNLAANPPPPRPSSNPPSAPGIPPPPLPPTALPIERPRPAISQGPPPPPPPPAQSQASTVNGRIENKAPSPYRAASPLPPSSSAASAPNLNGLQAALASRSRSRSNSGAIAGPVQSAIMPTTAAASTTSPSQVSYSLKPEAVQGIDDSKYKFQPDSALPAPRAFDNCPKVFRSGRPGGSTVPLRLDTLR